MHLIEGLLLTPLKRISHPKGEVLHAMKRSQPGFVDFGEAYFSMVLPKNIKGWKRHRNVTLNLVVSVGRIRFVIYDDRAASSTCGQFTDVTLGRENYARLTVPPGVWVAFMGVDDAPSLLLNIADQEHDPDEADNASPESFRFAW